MSLLASSRLKSLRKEYRASLAAARARRVVSGLGWLTVLILWIIGCGASYSSAWSQSRFWSQVRPDPGETERLVRNARYLKAAGRTQLALKELEEAHQKDPGNLRIVDVLTQCYEDLGEWQRAEELYLEALSESQTPALANNLCFSYYLAGKYEKAASSFQKLLAQHPQSTTIRNNLGLVLTRMGRQEEALALWEKAEGKAAAHQRLGQALAALGLSQPGGEDQQKAAQGIRPATSPEAIQQTADKTAFAHPKQDYPATVASAPAPSAAGFRQKPKQASRLPVLRAWELLYTKIEILNGNGVAHMARQNRSWLHQEGFDTVDIGNYENFSQDQTVIFYRPHAVRVAKVLGAKFYRTDNLKVDPELSEDLEVRVVLGRDVLQKQEVLAKLAD